MLRLKQERLPRRREREHAPNEKVPELQLKNKVQPGERGAGDQTEEQDGMGRKAILQLLLNVKK